jgi:hypothetical protein
MSTYRAPLAEMHFVLNELAGLSQVATLPGFEDATPDTVAAILEEASKFASDVLDPLNRTGDTEGSRLLENGNVKTPAGFKDAYRAYCENGWNGLTKNPDHGGQGLPQLVATAVEEMWHSSNMAFDLCPLLTQGAIVLLITDGLERDPDDRLEFEIDRLHRSARRLVWLNPLLRFEGFEAKARGIRTILPHVDEFRPIHNLDSIAELCRALSASGERTGDPKEWLKKVA